MTSTTLARVGLLLTALALAAGCGNRASYWDKPVYTAATSYGLATGVALVDDPDHRVVLVGATTDQQPTTASFSIGHNVSSVTTSPDGNFLFVLASGDWPPKSATDELPSLTVIDASKRTEQRYEMAQPLPNLAIDPLGDQATGFWAVAYSGAGTATTFVENPNEIVIFDLNAKPAPATATSLGNPVTRNIRSFGGTPQELTFTPQLKLPAPGNTSGVETRLLLIESNIDLTILDLGHAFDFPQPRPEITVQLTSGTTSAQLTPAGVVVDDGDANDPDDARIALWTTTDSNVYILTLGPSAPGAPNGFTPTINLAGVNGTPSDVAFVHTSTDPTTDYGLQVAALVPTQQSAVLIDPDMSAITQVSLPAAYSKLSLVTKNVGAASSGTDVALLWSQTTTSMFGGSVGGGTGVALWSLGQMNGGIDVVNVALPVQAVYDVDGATTSQLKVLQLVDSGGLVVLDLDARTASPLATTATSTTISHDGNRMWAFAQGGTDLTEINLNNLNLVQLTTDAPIDGVFDVTAGPGLPPKVIATHSQGTWGATIFDATNPQAATARRVSSLLLEAAQ